MRVQLATWYAYVFCHHSLGCCHFAQLNVKQCEMRERSLIDRETSLRLSEADLQRRFDKLVADQVSYTARDATCLVESGPVVLDADSVHSVLPPLTRLDAVPCIGRMAYTRL